MMCIKHSPAKSIHFKDFILYSQSKIATLNFKNTDWVPDKVQKISDSIMGVLMNFSLKIIHFMR